nr:MULTISPECIES: HalOD1 output domain-containing protein [unclassified Halorubrum]
MSAEDTEIILESFTFRPGSETYLARYDKVETSASMAVVATLTEISDVDPTEMDPLFRSIDVESLDALFRGATDGNVRVTSTVAGREVTVTNDAVIANRTPDDDSGTVGIGEVPST